MSIPDSIATLALDCVAAIATAVGCAAWIGVLIMLRLALA